ncbi:hypothetical protein K1719_000780 [Acacia pycnantha]|nr:hypothetical protein K1719_000780 [Acacia pycnantha]
MGTLVLLKKFTIFLLISVSLTASFAGRRTKFVSKLAAADVDVLQEEEMGKEEESVIHERLLRANTRDYGRYDPSPTLSKPPFKQIPN